MATPREALEALGKQMMKIEAELCTLTEEIKGLQASLAEADTAAETGVLLRFTMDGFDDEGATLVFTVEPASAGPDGASCKAVSGSKTAQMVVNSAEGSTISVTMRGAEGSEKSIGEWLVTQVLAEAVEESVSLAQEPEQAAVEKIASLKITADPLESLAAQIAAKEKEVDELTKQRGAIRDQKAKLIKLNQQRQQQEQQQGGAQGQQQGLGGAAATAADSKKTSRWNVVLRALDAPRMAFQVAATLVSDPRTRPLRDVVYFVSGVVLLKFYGDDLAV